MQNVAAMKSLRLLDEEHHNRRRTSMDVSDEVGQVSLRTQLKDFVLRILDKYTSFNLEQDESQY